MKIDEIEVMWKHLKGKDVVVFGKSPFFSPFDFEFDGDKKTLRIIKVKK